MNTRTRTINSDTTITNRLLGGFRRGLHSPSWRVLALIVAPVFSYAQFVPAHFTSQSAYAGTNSGFSYMNSHDDALNGAPATLFENTSKAGSGGEYAWVQREGSIDATQVWLKAQSSTTQRSSTFVDGWYDFQVTTDKVRLDWAVTMTPLVWWDQSIVRVYNMTTGGILISHNVTGTGVDELVVTPGHNLRLYTGFNQNNLNQWSYPAGNTAFLAEGRLSAPIQAFQGRVTLQDWQGSMVGEPLTVTIRNAANAIVQGPETTTTTTNGSWNLPTSLANGTYKVTVKGRTWLSASVGNVVLSGGST
ncbi:MAG: hypothetical protein K8R88_08380, partial [Armatimonadetes bacterium]|nr:hypothetical protein [Armatimonadota bacterium]